MNAVLDRVEGYEALRGTGAFVRVLRDVVSVSGPDAVSFLQSLVSQDLDGLAVGETRHSLFLQPQGKLIADFRVARVAEAELWLVGARGSGEALAAGLRRFKIRVKAEIDDRSDDLETIAVRGAAAASIAVSGGERVGAQWPGNDGCEFVGQIVATPALPEAPYAAYETLRIECGVPEYGAELDESIIAQEAFLDRDAVSFTKGCFVGQELVCRIDSRGHVNRYLRGLVCDSNVTVRDSVVVGDKTVGAVTSVAQSPVLGTVALGFVRREVEPTAACVVGPGVSATIRELPLR